MEPKDRCARYEELAGGCLTAQLQFVFKEDCATALAMAREDAATKKLPLVALGSVCRRNLPHPGRPVAL